jgi:Rho family protein
VIEWLYTGDCHRLPGRVSAAEIQQRGAAVAERRFAGGAIDDQILSETERAAEALGCPELVTFVHNIRAGEHVLNVSFSTFVMDQSANRAGRILLGSDLLADVTLELDDGSRIPAHATILATRCPALNPVLRRSDQPDEHGRKRVQLAKMGRAMCMAMLEFIYRDHLDFQAGETASVGPIELLQQARTLELKRLVTLCELQITKLVDRAVTESIRKSEFDVIGLLNVASTHGATQLEAWCLHFISTNFGPMQERWEWVQLAPQHLTHVTAHQWPPIAYTKAIAKYETDHATWAKGRPDKAARRWLW